MRRKLLEQMGEPVGDPFGGPAYGRRDDPGTLLSVGGSLLGSALTSNAVGNAADTQAAATNAGINAQNAQFQQTRADQAPFRDAGVSAIGRLRTLLGIGGSPVTSGPLSSQVAAVNTPSVYSQLVSDLTPKYTTNGVTDWNAMQNEINQRSVGQGYSDIMNPDTSPDSGALNQKFSIADFWNDPVVQESYQSGLDLGTKALKNAAPLTTGLDSGAALKELTKFGTDYTGNMAAGSQARFVGDQNNQYNRLMGIVTGAGMPATNATTTAGTNTTNAITGLIGAQGNAAAAGQIAGANAWNGGLSSVSNWWNQQQLLKSLPIYSMNNNGYNINPYSFSTNASYGPPSPYE